GGAGSVVSGTGFLWGALALDDDRKERRGRRGGRAAPARRPADRPQRDVPALEVRNRRRLPGEVLPGAARLAGRDHGARRREPRPIRRRLEPGTALTGAREGRARHVS